MAFWLPLAATVGMGLLGAHQGRKRAEREADIQNRTANMRAAEQQYSPWTGRTNFTDVKFAGTGGTDAMLSGALAGGLTGASLGSSADKFFEGLGGAEQMSPNMQQGTGYLGANTQLQANQSFMPKSSWDQLAMNEEQKKLVSPTAGGSFLGGNSLRF